ncbi:MAG: metallophosphatase [Bacteroidales bacterium]|nr:metallophosphatase [Bacteroidales bacterium]
MKRIIAAALAATVMAACAPQARRLTIVHANDTHSHLEPTRHGTEGVIERAAFIDSIRKADGKRNVLLVHAGDFNQGSPYYTVLGGKLEVNLVNALGYDCIELGNHEFDSGVEDLTGRAANLRCRLVCANYDFSSIELGKYVKPYAVFKRGGYKVGIVGLLCDISKVVNKNVADGIRKVEGSDADIVNGWTSYLREQEGCDLVLALTHIGYAEDIELASKLHGVDAIIGGHSHTRIDEPAWVSDADGKKILVVTDWCWGHTVGVLTVTY